MTLNDLEAEGQPVRSAILATARLLVCTGIVAVGQFDPLTLPAFPPQSGEDVKRLQLLKP